MLYYKKLKNKMNIALLICILLMNIFKSKTKEDVNKYVNNNNINNMNERGYTILMIAATNNYFELAKELIIRGADINIKTYCVGETALFSACRKGNIDIIKLLLNNNADVNILNIYGESVLHVSQYDALNLLLQHPILNVINQKTIHGDTPIKIACRYGDIEMVEKLLNYGADSTITDNNEFTCLHASCYNNNFKITEKMIELGIPINHLNINNRTALHIAHLKYPHYHLNKLLDGGYHTYNNECANILLQNNADTNIRDIFNNLAINYL